MKTCTRCMATNPATASFCMQCGQLLPDEINAASGERQSTGGFGVFGLSLLASLALSLVLMYVFKLPVFLLFGFLPLLWSRRRR